MKQVPEVETDPEAEEDDKRAKMRKKKEDKERRMMNSMRSCLMKLLLTKSLIN